MESSLHMDALTTMPLDHSIDQSLLNIEEKTRANLFPWNGQFSPQLIESLLTKYATGSEQILDPFMGSGTVLIEAARKGFSAVGSDINPAPYKMASVYRLCNIRETDRGGFLQEVESELLRTVSDDFTLVACSEEPKDVRAELIQVKDQLNSEEATILLDALIVLVDFHRPIIDANRVFAVWKQLKRKVAELPYSKKKIEVLNQDARELACKTGSCSMMLTSPPYVNVFNYHQKYRRSAEALGWDLLHVAQSEIGSNRKHRGNRFLTVTQYCMDLTMALAEAKRICKPDARFIIVLGRESQVRKTRFYNGDMVVSLAKDCVGLKPLIRQERVFMNRFGSRITEDILHFENSTIQPNRDPRDVARNALVEAKKYAPDESLIDLEEALERLNEIMPSPIYKNRNFEAKIRPRCATNSAS